MDGLTRYGLVPVFCLLAMAAHAASSSTAPQGRNPKLDIAFQVEGNTRWCGATVKVTLKAKAPSLLQQPSEEFQQMIGRIRGIIQGECPEVRSLAVSGLVKSKIVSSANVDDLTGWRYIPSPSENRAAQCVGPENAALCAQRWSVFDRLRTMFIKDGLRRFQLTTFLTTEGASDAEFQYGDASGRVRYLPIPSGQQAPALVDLVNRQIEGLASQCTGTSLKGEAVSFTKESVGRKISCQTDTEIRHSYFVINQLGTAAGFDVYAFADFTNEGLMGDQLFQRFRTGLNEENEPVSQWDRVYDDTFPELAIPNLQVSVCKAVAEKFGSVADKMIAVRLRPVGTAREELSFQVLRTDNGKPDSWRMNFNDLPPVDLEAVRKSTALATWLVFKAVERPNGRYFENQLLGINAENVCVAVTPPTSIDVDQMPLKAVKLYQKHLSLKVAKEDQGVIRNALRVWGAERPSP